MADAKDHDITPDMVLAKYVYYPQLGQFERKWNNSHGKRVGLGPNYSVLSLGNGRTIQAHRAVYLIETGSLPADPTMVIDHIDGNKGNNRISNLRAVTRSQNQFNHPRHRKAAQ